MMRAGRNTPPQPSSQGEKSLTSLPHLHAFLVGKETAHAISPLPLVGTVREGPFFIGAASHTAEI